MQVLDVLRTRTFTTRLSLPTLLHHLAVAPSKAPTSLDFSRAQRFNLASLLSFLAPSNAMQPDFRVASPPPSPSASPKRVANHSDYGHQHHPHPHHPHLVSPLPVRTASPPPSPASTIHVVMERIRMTLRNLQSLCLQSNIYLNDITLINSSCESLSVPFFTFSR